MPVRGCHLERLGSAFGSVAAWEHHVSLSGSCSSCHRGQGTCFPPESTGVLQPFLQPTLQLARGRQELARPSCSIYTSLTQPRPTPGRTLWNGNILPLYWKSNLWQQNSAVDAVTFLWLAKVGWKWQ